MLVCQLRRFVIGLLTPAGQAAFHRWAQGQPEPQASRGTICFELPLRVKGGIPNTN